MNVPVAPAGSPWTAWVFEPFTVAGLLVAMSLYAAGSIRVRRRGGAVSRGRQAAWYAGIATLAFALLSPVDAYADVSFAIHMTQHLLLTFIAVPLLALGAPIALALRALEVSRARRLSAVLRSRPALVLANPVVGWLVFVGTSWAIHFSPLFDLALRSNGWHAVEHLLWVVTACIYWWPIVGADPEVRPVAYPIRMLSLFLLMPAMSFLSLALLTASAPLYPTYARVAGTWGAGALASQRAAATVMWVGANLLLLLAMLFVAAAWKQADDERQRRLEAREDARAAAGG
ncbi:MAG: cytochrome c oxidase assembly protein [Planctomycetaceae bacterium]